jgi:hypothetical protein
MKIDSENENNGIFKPSTIIYYIARDENGTIRDNGSVGVGLVWTTKWKDIKEFVKKQDWLDELLDNGITPKEDLMPFN